ncbi:MAG: hypothetical protein ACKVT2_17250 [Saprospiraceae bacterium]
MDKVSVCFAIAVFMAQLFYKLWKKQHPELQDLISSAFTAATLPTGGELIFYALFKPEEVLKINDIRIQIAISGAVVLFLGISCVVKGFIINPKLEGP